MTQDSARLQLQREAEQVGVGVLCMLAESMRVGWPGGCWAAHLSRLAVAEHWGMGTGGGGQDWKRTD